MTPRELVLAQFPGRVAIPLIEAGKAIGLAAQTSYNLHHRGKFPMRVIKQNRKPMVSLIELIDYLEQRVPAPELKQVVEPPRHSRGRPRNSEREVA